MRLSTLISEMVVSSSILLTIKTIEIESITPKGRTRASESVAAEVCLEIVLNLSSVAEVSCSPGLEKELAVGFLITGNLIAGYFAIESCRVSVDVCRITTSDVADPTVTPHEPLRAVSFRTVADAVADRLRRGYLRDPKVSAQVTTLRPFYILGEVNTAGSFAYQPGITVQNAIAIAGGYGARADQAKVLLTRKTADGTKTYKVPVTTQIYPGDIIYVRERWF